MVNQAFSVREASCSFFSFVQKATTQLTHDLIRFISSPPEGAQTQFFFISLSKPGCGVVRSRRFLGGVGVGFLTTLRVRVGFFCPTPDVQSDHFLHHYLKLGIPVEMVQILLKLILKQISCCAPRFPLILTDKFSFPFC